LIVINVEQLELVRWNFV